jgi:hypothetical protein
MYAFKGYWDDVIGHWVVKSNEPICSTYWSYFKDKVCCFSCLHDAPCHFNQFFRDVLPKGQVYEYAHAKVLFFSFICSHCRCSVMKHLLKIFVRVMTGERCVLPHLPISIGCILMAQLIVQIGWVLSMFVACKFIHFTAGEVWKMGNLGGS